MTYEEMYALACKNLAPRDYSEHCTAGYVSAVIEGGNGKYYTGVNLDLACGLGFCAERNAAGNMVTEGERAVRRIVCVDRRGNLMTPCGSCREFLMLLSPANADAEFLVGLSPQRTVRLAELLPHWWETFGQ